MSDIQIGTEIGGYRLEALLGGGGFGSVWRARAVDGGKVVAVKVLTGAYATGDVARQRAEIELLAGAATSSSPNVVRVYGGGVEPVPYVVMEFIDGTDLATLLRQHGPVSVSEALRIGSGIAGALDALHEGGIIHRDVKPANVMVDKTGQVKLTDFGIAKIVGYDTVTATGQMPMSMAYAAPEVWEGRPSHQSDLYALGIVIYQCLVGDPPFTGTFAEIYRKHLTDTPSLDHLPKETPPALRDLLLSCMSKVPEARPASARVCLEQIHLAIEQLSSGSRTIEAPAAAAPQGPSAFGPWIPVSREPIAPWTWQCRNPATGETARVEVVASDDLAAGDQLRAAVAANPALIPFGAERLIGTNRMVMRPDETWPEPPSGRFQFWVAREDVELPPQPTLPQPGLLASARTVAALRTAAASLAVEVAVGPATTRILPEGRIRLVRPGLPSASTTGEELADWLGATCEEPLEPAAVASLVQAMSGTVRSAGSWTESAPVQPGVAVLPRDVSGQIGPYIDDSTTNVGLQTNIPSLKHRAPEKHAGPEPVMGGAQLPDPGVVPVDAPRHRRQSYLLAATAAFFIVALAAIGIVLLAEDGSSDPPAKPDHSALAAEPKASPSPVPTQSNESATPGASGTVAQANPGTAEVAPTAVRANGAGAAATAPPNPTALPNTAVAVAPTATPTPAPTPMAVATPLSVPPVGYPASSYRGTFKWRGTVVNHWSGDSRFPGMTLINVQVESQLVGDLFADAGQSPARTIAWHPAPCAGSYPVTIQVGQYVEVFVEWGIDSYFDLCHGSYYVALVAR